MTEDKRHELNELSVSDVMSYLSARVFAMEEHARRESKALIKAKELLARWVSDKPYTVSEQKDLISDTEQFLKEE